MTVAPHMAQAQNCTPPAEMVTKLFYPELGSYTVWDNAYGEPRKREAFKSSVPLEDGSVLAVGEMRYLPEVAPALMIVLFDKRGRKIWEKFHALGQVKNVVKILPHDKGHMVLVNRRGDRKSGKKSYTTLLFLDKEAKIIRQKNISHKSYNITATDILQTGSSEKNIVISVTEQYTVGSGDNATERRKAAIHILDNNGNDLDRREYSLGISSEILSLENLELQDKMINYIATGYFENDVGQKIGWVLRLNKDASYVWHKEFGRGSGAIVSDAHSYKNQDIITGGTINAADSDQTGAWMMRLDGLSGEIKWQRYYYSEKNHYSYEAQDIVVNSDGVITFLMAAKEKETEATEKDSDIMNYAHLLNLSPRGITLNGEAYYKGHDAYINEMNLGANEQYVLTGDTWQTAQKALEQYKEKEGKTEPEIMLPEAEISQKSKEGLERLKGKMAMQKEEEKRLDSDEEPMGDSGQELDQNGWIMIGVSADTYTDPCK